MGSCPLQFLLLQCCRPGGLEEEIEGVLEVDTEPLGVLGRGDADEELPVSEM